MSGSPIIQDGKLVGAVTRVILLCGASVPLGAMHSARLKTSHRGAICARSLVSKLTDSLRLIIENMLSAAESQIMPKAA